MPAIEQLVVGGRSGPWSELGFAVAQDSFQAGSVSVRLTGDAAPGLLGWSVSGLSSTALDGLATEPGNGAARGPGGAHPNGVVGIDHVVVATPDLERTLAALAAAGLDLRRRREAESPAGRVQQAFYRLGEVVLEVVTTPGAAAGPAAFWGLVFTVADIDACAQLLGDRLGSVKQAVQPGRRIATVRREAGLGLPVALISPDPRPHSTGV